MRIAGRIVLGALAVALVVLVSVDGGGDRDSKRDVEDDGTTDDACKQKKNIDKCTKINEQCVLDQSNSEGFRCDCKEGESRDEDGKCKDACMQKKNIDKCTEINAECVPEQTELEGFMCVCNEGESKDEDGKCKADPCTNNPCKNGGTCRPKEDSYDCLCPERYNVTNCDGKVCLVTEEEECGQAPCVYDKRVERRFCDCGDGSEFDDATKECKAMDACLLKTLNNECRKPRETCSKGECDCEKNYKYSKDNATCEENFCSTAHCPENSNCVELGAGNVLCTCKDGFVQKGEKCEKVDFCSPGRSQCEQRCIENMEKCGCETGFTLNEDGKTCRANSEEDPDCDLDCGVGTCLKRNNSNSTCVCPSVTHTFSGTTCIDKCTANNFTAPEGMCPSSECEPSETHGFRCKCRNPYQQDADGIHCKRKAMCNDTQVKERCAKKSALCQETPTGEGYRCVCDPGFDEENGVCVGKCDMKVNRDKCERLRATCELDSNYGAVCKCPPLMKGGINQVCDTLGQNSYIGLMRVLKTKYVIRYSKGRFRSSTENIDHSMLRADLTESIHNTYGEDVTDMKILQCQVTESLVVCTTELQLADESKKDVNIITSPSVCLPLNERHCLLKPNLIMRTLRNNRDVFQEAQPCNESVKKRLCGESTNCTGDKNDFRCTCKNGFYRVSSYKPKTPGGESVIEQCEDVCTKKEIAAECEQLNETCRRDERVEKGYTCVCRKGDVSKDGKCIDVCDQTKNIQKCEELNKVCVRAEAEEEGFECVCREGDMVGKDGKCVADPCANSPCENGGTCVPKEDTFECRCSERFDGLNCHKKVCLASEKEECGQEANCVYDELVERRFCDCGAGKEFAAKECKAMDACLMKTLNNECSKPHETCSKGECECEENYKHSKDNAICEENFCKNTDRCPSNSDCSELGSGNVLCVCKDRYVQKGGMCRKINLCTPGVSKCDQMCDPKTGKCSCETGFTLDEDGNTCKADNAKDPDCDLDCGGGTCVKRGSTKKCVCPSVTHVLSEGTCIDKCTKNKFKAPSDMCSSGSSAPAGCELSDDHVFRCKCEDPFEQDQDGIHCRRKAMCGDENVMERCANQSAICEETLAGKGYRCVCDRGFVEENGTCVRKCDTKAQHEKCASLRATCELDSNDRAVCRCPPLMKPATKGGVCDTLDDHSFTGTLRILKSKYVVRDAKRRSRRSTDDVDWPMLEGDVTNAVKETYKGTRFENSASAKILHCDVEESELLCTLELSLAGGTVNDTKILLSPSVCLLLDDEHCVVKPDLLLTREEDAGVLKKTEACEGIVKEKLCGSSTDCVPEGQDGFQCKCKKGFYAIGTFQPISSRSNTFIQKCNDIDECSRSSPCPASTDCVNNYGGYECFCKDGYKKKHALSRPKEDGCDALCDPNPCHNGTCFVVGHHGFSCNCTKGYTGILCNTTTQVVPEAVAEKQNKNAAVVGGVLGAILVVVVVAGLIVYKRMQDRQNDDEEYARQRQKSIMTQMNRLRKEQPRLESDPDDRRAPRQGARDSGEYRREFADQRVIPRIQTPRDEAGASSRDGRKGSNVYYKNRGYDEEEE